MTNRFSDSFISINKCAEEIHTLFKIKKAIVGLGIEENTDDINAKNAVINMLRN